MSDAHSCGDFDPAQIYQTGIFLAGFMALGNDLVGRLPMIDHMIDHATNNVDDLPQDKAEKFLRDIKPVYEYLMALQKQNTTMTKAQREQNIQDLKKLFEGKL